MNSVSLEFRVRDAVTELWLRFEHPMESGERRDTQGTRIPARYIEQLRVKRDEQLLCELELGPQVSRHPVLALQLRNLAVGDRLRVEWQDTLGERGTQDIINTEYP